MRRLYTQLEHNDALSGDPLGPLSCLQACKVALHADPLNELHRRGAGTCRRSRTVLLQQAVAR